MSTPAPPTGPTDDLRDRLERRLHTCTEVCPDGVPPDLCEFALDSHYAIDVLLPTILAYADQRADEALEMAATVLIASAPMLSGWSPQHGSEAATIVRSLKTAAS